MDEGRRRAPSKFPLACCCAGTVDGQVDCVTLRIGRRSCPEAIQSPAKRNGVTSLTCVWRVVLVGKKPTKSEVELFGI